LEFRAVTFQMSAFALKTQAKLLYLCFLVIYQDFKAHVDQETYVILGNNALLKCDIPSFVTDLVDIFGWIDNQGNEFMLNYGTFCSSDFFQFYISNYL
jgi:hypothetical protein